MPATCGHNPPRLPPPGEPYSTAYCRTCWNYEHDPRYRAYWDGRPVPPTPPVPLPEPVPYADWPAWIKAVATMRAEGETGAGDTIHRLLTTLGVAWFWKRFVVMMLGDCGCEVRRRTYNARHPYQSLKE